MVSNKKSMMIRLDALPYLKHKLEWQLSDLTVKINRNSRTIKDLARKQRLLKDTRHEIGQMLRFLNEREKDGLEKLALKDGKEKEIKY